MSGYLSLAQNPYQQRTISLCPACGQEIYEHEEVYHLEDGAIIHRDFDCLMEHYKPESTTIEEALERE